MKAVQALHTPSSAELDLLVRTVKAVASARHVAREDAEEFLQVVQLRMLETNYRVFAKFSGHSSLRTYLTVVITHLLADWRNSQYGKWRSSVAASRLGPDALALERLIVRDGYSTETAIAVYRGHRPAQTEAALRRLADSLPARPRRRMMRVETVDALAHGDFHDPVVEAERARHALKVRKSLVRALKAMPTEERQLINLRFGRSQSVRAIGHQLQTDPKALYRRFDRILAALRHSLAVDGITAMSA